MAQIVFPPNPNVGDTVTGEYGEVYTWDGVKWTITPGGGGGGGGGDFVLKTGDTMTGPLDITQLEGTPAIGLTVEAATPGTAAIQFHTPPSPGLIGNTDDVVWQVVAESGEGDLAQPSPLSFYGTVNGGARTLVGQFLVGGNFIGAFAARGYCSRAGTNAALPGGSNLWNISYNVGDGSVSIYLGTANLGYLVPPPSDYRIKKDVADLPSMWEAVKELRPISYTRAQYTMPGVGGTIEADDVERWGFLAHELQETLVPTVSTGVKDEPDALQRPDPLTVIAALTKALQEAMERIEALEAKAV